MWALIVSFVALILIATSYFTKDKSGFLLLQALGMIFLMASYLLDSAYFAMIGLGIGLARALIFFWFEKKDKKPSVFWPILFSVLSVMAYVVVNLIILKTSNWYDVIYLIGLILYAFVFWVRDLKKVLYLTTVPTMMSILYNILSKAAVFAVLSYVFEFGANLLAIYKFQTAKKREKKSEEKR
jgi:hypothetical protein